MAENLKCVVIGCGNMGSSHARSFASIDGFELVGLVDVDVQKRGALAKELGVQHEFESLTAALTELRPDVVGICTYPGTHAELAIEAMNAGAHVFVEKPLALTVERAMEVVEVARANKRKMTVGYILRQHPGWQKLIEVARTLGSPLVMRMNLNQQSKGYMWDVHKNLMQTMSPIVDCGVHYVDIMCLMTQSRPIRVQAIGARLSEEIPEGMYNYGNLQVSFENGSVGWYEAGWGPMMSETAFFVKDIIGPKGSVSVVMSREGQKYSSCDISSHTKTNWLQVHHGDIDGENNLLKEDEWIDTRDEPDHQELCNREQRWLLQAIQEDLDLSVHWDNVVDTLRIVLAADQSIAEGRAIDL